MLQTRHAQVLVRGRNENGKPPIIGLIGFADRLRVIWHAAEANDPYADWWLIKIHDAIATLDVRIKQERSNLRKSLNSERSFLALPAQSREPFRIQLRFASPYAYRAAQLLAEFDAFVGQALTAVHVGSLSRKQFSSDTHSIASRIRGLFNIPSRFRHLGIDRANPASLEGHGETAKRYMGEIPKDIESGARRAMYAPSIRLNGSESVPPVFEESELLKGLDV